MSIPSTMSNPAKPRQNHIDIIKGWSIMLIVLFHQHNPFSTTAAAWLIGRGCSVPIFFILAGFFMKEDRLVHPKSYLWNKVKTLYLPSTVISVSCILLHNVFIKIGWYPIDSTFYYSFGYTVHRVIRSLCCLDSGEPLMGAMWFVYALMYDLAILSLLSCLLKRLFKRDGVWQKAMAVVLLICMSVSCYLAQKEGIVVERVSVVLSSMFLIWVGKIINQKIHWSFDNTWVFVFSVLIFIEEILLGYVHPLLTANRYQSVVQLIVICGSSIYALGYIGKLISSSYLGKAFAYMGRESFYIMAFHPAGYYCCNMICEWLGINHPGDKRGMYTYLIEDPIKTILYLAAGCIVPLIILSIVNSCKRLYARMVSQ